MRVASSRSLSAPLRVTSLRRSRIVGREAATSGRSSRRNGASRFVAGLDSATSTSRSSSVARRFTNVVLARRSVVGSSPSARASATFSWPIAAAVAFVLPTRSARSSRRSATAVTAREELTMNSVSVPSSWVSWLTRRREVERNGLKYSADSAACRALALVLRGEALDDALEVLARVRVERVEELVEVDDVGGRADGERRAVVERLRRVRRRRQRDVAVGDARQRGQADHGLGALAQRRVGLLDLDPHAGAVVVGQRDRADRADPAAADLHVVALDELAGVLEHQVVLVRVTPAQEEHGDEHDGERQGGDGHAPGDRHPPPPKGKRSAATSIRTLSHVTRVSMHGQGPCERGKLSVIRLLRVTSPESLRPPGRMDGYSMPSGPRDAPERNWRTNMLSELNSSSAGPDSTIRPFHSTAMYSATRLADMMSWVITT